MSINKPKYESVDEYISKAPADIQDVLQAIRKTIRKAVPGAEEMIRYDMPSYHLNGKPLIHFAMQKKHITIHPGTITVKVFMDKLDEYTCTKGGIQFPNGRPVPYDLIGEIVQYKARKSNCD